MYKHGESLVNNYVVGIISMAQNKVILDSPTLQRWCWGVSLIPEFWWQWGLGRPSVKVWVLVDHSAPALIAKNFLPTCTSLLGLWLVEKKRFISFGDQDFSVENVNIPPLWVPIQGVLGEAWESHQAAKFTVWGWISSSLQLREQGGNIRASLGAEGCWDLFLFPSNKEFWEFSHQLPGWGRLCSPQGPAVVWNFVMEPSLVRLLSSGSWSWKLFCQDWGSWSGFSEPQNWKWVLKWFYDVFPFPSFPVLI